MRIALEELYLFPSGEPNNAGRRENCMNIYPSGMWNDNPCDWENSHSGIICKGQISSLDQEDIQVMRDACITNHTTTPPTLILTTVPRDPEARDPSGLFLRGSNNTSTSRTTTIHSINNCETAFGRLKTFQDWFYMFVEKSHLSTLRTRPGFLICLFTTSFTIQGLPQNGFMARASLDSGFK